MNYDVFFSISQTPVDGVTPSEAVMLRNFFDQVQAADELGFGTAWVAESHFSTQVQKRHDKPVVPHWQGEIGLNNDIYQLAHQVFSRTRRIEVGAAVANLVCAGGPIAHAERVASFASLHGVDPSERRRLRLGFSAGRFQFMNRAYGVVPRDEIEAVAWPALRGMVFAEACEIFLRLLRGDSLSSGDVSPTVLTRDRFRTDEHWEQVCAAARAAGRLDDDRILIPNRWAFDVLQVIPTSWRRELIDLVLGSHDPALQERVNQWLPVKVFNLSITQPEVINDTHRRMAAAYHPSGGAWKRAYMPRTVMVFLNEEEELTPDSRNAAAQEEAHKALSAYWTALEGTLDPKKVERAAHNAVIGNAQAVASQIAERFHPDDVLMLWFDFFNHDSDRVMRNMRAFRDKVAPLVAEAVAAQGAS